MVPTLQVAFTLGTGKVDSVGPVCDSERSASHTLCSFGETPGWHGQN